MSICDVPYHLWTVSLVTEMRLKLLYITLNFTNITIDYIANSSKQKTIYQIHKTNEILTQWQTSWFMCYQCTTQSVELQIFIKSGQTDT